MTTDQTTDQQQSSNETTDDDAGPTPMKFLGRDDILAIHDEAFEIVDVPEWGGSVRVRGLTGAERDTFEASMFARNKSGTLDMNMNNLRAKLVMLSVVDHDEKPIFRRTDIDALGAKSAKALDRIYDVAQKLSGLRKEDIDALVGKSEETLDGSSTSF
jgi:hypothetical protein